MNDVTHYLKNSNPVKGLFPLFSDPRSIKGCINNNDAAKKRGAQWPIFETIDFKISWFFISIRRLYPFQNPIFNLARKSREKNEILFNFRPLAGCFWNGFDPDFDNVRNAVRRVRGSHADYVNDTASQRWFRGWYIRYKLYRIISLMGKIIYLQQKKVYF